MYYVDCDTLLRTVFSGDQWKLLARNERHVNYFISHDTLLFAISSVDQWKLPAVNYISLLLVVTSEDYLYLTVN